MPMRITTTAKQPFERIFLDIVGPLPISLNNSKYLLTVLDDLTKYFIAIPIINQESETVADAFVENVICIYGSPQEILTDQGSNFMGSVFKSICKLLKIRKLNTTSYHPQTNGALERTHRTITEYLRHFINSDRNNWDSWINYAAFTYNTTPHTSTQYMPYELLFGHKPSLPNCFKQDPERIYNYDDYIVKLKYRMQQSHKVAHDHLINAKETSKLQYDKTSNENVYKIGDFVLLHDETQKNNLESIWLGPFQVIEIPTEENITIKIGKSLRTVHKNRIKKFYD